MSTTARIFLLAAVVLAIGCPHAPGAPVGDDDDGNASQFLATTPPNHAVQAAFAKRSYAPGETAVLRLRGDARGLDIRVFRAGFGGDGPLQGAPVAVERATTFRIGDWPSGLYYARVATPGKGVWYAPFIVRPPRLGTARIAVVLPTNTWQAYNFEDGDSWYENASVHRIDLARPFVDGGVPPHYRGYDRGFVRWRFRANGRISGAATVVAGLVYFSTLSGRTYALSARTGRIVRVWDDGKYSPAVADASHLYFVGLGRLYALVPR